MTETRSPDLTRAIPAFLRRQHADSTRLAYEREIGRFLAWLDALDAETLPRYVEMLRVRKLSATTVAWRASVVASFLKDAHRQEVISEDLTAGYRLPKGTRGFAPKVLTAAELRKLLDAPDGRSWAGKRDRAVLVAMGIGGLRAGEVADLRLGDVQATSHAVSLRVRGKGATIRRVVFEGRNAGPLRAWLRTRGEGGAPVDALFVARRLDGGAAAVAFTVARVDYLVRRTARMAGLEGVHAHSLRHTAASLCLAGGAGLHEVRDLLGHASITTTSRYLHVAGVGRAATSYLAGVLR